MSLFRPTAAKVIQEVSKLQQSTRFSTRAGFRNDKFAPQNGSIASSQKKLKPPSRPSYKPKRSPVSRNGRTTPRCLQQRDEGISMVGCNPLRIRTDNNGSAIATNAQSKKQFAHVLPTTSPLDQGFSERDPSTLRRLSIAESIALRRKRLRTPATPMRQTKRMTPNEMVRGMVIAQGEADLDAVLRGEEKREHNESPIVGMLNKLPSERLTTPRTPRTTLRTILASRRGAEKDEPSVRPFRRISSKLRLRGPVTPRTPVTPNTMVQTMMSGPRVTKHEPLQSTVNGVSSKLEAEQQFVPLDGMMALEPDPGKHTAFRKPEASKQLTKQQMTPLTSTPVRTMMSGPGLAKREPFVSPITGVSSKLTAKQSLPPMTAVRTMMSGPSLVGPEPLISPIMGTSSKLHTKQRVTPMMGKPMSMMSEPSTSAWPFKTQTRNFTKLLDCTEEIMSAKKKCFEPRRLLPKPQQIDWTSPCACNFVKKKVDRCSTWKCRPSYLACPKPSGYLKVFKCPTKVRKPRMRRIKVKTRKIRLGYKECEKPAILEKVYICPNVKVKVIPPRPPTPTPKRCPCFKPRELNPPPPCDKVRCAVNYKCPEGPRRILPYCACNTFR